MLTKNLDEKKKNADLTKEIENKVKELVKLSTLLNEKDEQIQDLKSESDLKNRQIEDLLKLIDSMKKVHADSSSEDIESSSRSEFTSSDDHHDHDDSIDDELDFEQEENSLQLALVKEVEDRFKPLAIVYPNVIHIQDTYTFENLKVDEAILKNVQSRYLWEERTFVNPILSDKDKQLVISNFLSQDQQEFLLNEIDRVKNSFEMTVEKLKQFPPLMIESSKSYSITYQRKKRRLNKGKSVIVEQERSEVKELTKIEKMDERIKKKLENDQFLTPKEYKRHLELTDIKAQSDQGIQSSQVNEEMSDSEMIEALQDLDDEDDLNLTVHNPESISETEIELNYPYEFYDEVLNFEFNEPTPEVKKTVEFAFSNKIMFLLQKGFNRVYLLGRTEEELDMDIQKLKSSETEEGEFDVEKHFEDLEAENPRTLLHPVIDRMKKDELKDWLFSRNYHVRQMENMNITQLRRMVETFQIKEKAERRMVKLHPFKDKYIDVSEKKPIHSPKKKSMIEIKEKYNIKSKVVRPYKVAKFVPSSKEEMENWFPKRPIGVSVRSLVEKGQTVQELLAKTVAYSTDHKAKIIAWKFDEDFKGFIIKRINGACEVYYFFTHIARLEQQDLKELRSLSLENHKFSVRGTSCEFMLDKLFTSDKDYYLSLAKLQDAKYLHEKSEEYKKKKTAFVPGLIRQFMLDDIAKYLPKLEQQGVKVFTGDQTSHPILRWFYDTGNKELVLARQKFEKVIGKDFVQDLCYFIHMIEILSVAYEKMALRKELLSLNVGTLKITSIKSLEINNRRNLIIKSATRNEEMFTKDDILNLAQETIEEMSQMPIIVKVNKHSKVVDQFKQYIKAVRDFWSIKPLSEFVEVKEEEIEEL
ncbi:hypothetical protein QVD17_24442 [Tagetes erecta]|uniref:Uncharacterized protein n=1 Tax=Tagetes erecta TaxID=13708 RepID=A0AAD8KHV9_TARER|nr:hypothetical protein QVD17_24442 [Tagetes erecta]